MDLRSSEHGARQLSEYVDYRSNEYGENSTKLLILSDLLLPFSLIVQVSTHSVQEEVFPVFCILRL